MCILIVQFAMLVAGVLALLRGEVPLTKTHFVDGWPARVAGVLLLLPLPLSFLVGFVIGFVHSVRGQSLQPQELDRMVLFIDLPIMAVCGFLAAGFCLGSVASDSWRGRTYLSDAEGGLGSWNAPYPGPAGLDEPARPRRKRKKQRSRARSACAGSGAGVMAAVVGLFLVLGLAVSGGAVWLVNEQVEQPGPVVQNNAGAPPPVVPAPAKDAAPAEEPARPAPEPAPTGPNKAQLTEEKPAEARTPATVQAENKPAPEPKAPAPQQPPTNDRPQPPSTAAGKPLSLATRIDPYLAAAIAPDCRSAWVARAGGEVQRYSCPDFALQASYTLPGKAYQLALDGRGTLYAAVQSSKDKPAPESLGAADLHLFDTGSLPAPGTALVPIKVIPVRGVVRRLAVSPDDAWLYFLDTENHKVGRVDLKQGRLQRVTTQIAPGTNALCLTPNGKTLYTCSTGNVVQQLDAATLRVDKTFKLDRGKPNGIQATGAGYVFLSSGEEQGTGVYVLDTNHRDKGATAVVPWAAVENLKSIRLSPDQQCLYAEGLGEAPAEITALQIGENPVASRGRPFGSLRLDAASGRGQMEVSRDGHFLFCDCGAIVLCSR